MNRVTLLLTLAACMAAAACSTTEHRRKQVIRHMPQPTTFHEFQALAQQHDAVLTMPRFEDSPEAIEQAAARAMRTADTRMDALAAQNRKLANFDSTILALDDIYYEFNTDLSRIYLIKVTSTSEDVRNAANQQVKVMSDWFVEAGYREDVYNACKQYADAVASGARQAPKGESARLLDHTMRDYRRSGMHLDKATRANLEDLQKQLSRTTTDFSKNIADAKLEVSLMPYQLEGTPDSVLEQLPREGEAYVIAVTNVAQYMAVMNSCPKEETRRTLKLARYAIAQEHNLPVLNEMIRLRREIATMLGYNSWADYRTEILMSGSGDTALTFLEDLNTGLQPKFDAEIERMRAMKATDTGDPNTNLHVWDFRYYQNEIAKRQFSVDAEKLRVYFPLDNTIDGMFDVYASIFNLEFTEIEPPQKWINDLRLFVTSDAKTREPLGMFYLDMFPRDGKYKHFAQFDIITGKQLTPSRYQRPVVALVCNFTPPAAGKPSLLLHSEVETLFHEFGHALHSIVTRAKTGRFAGTGVPRDFVEAPSQMLETWVWDTGVLNKFAAHYKDPTRKIDPSVLARMEEAKLATVATFYRRQLCFGIGDLRLHTATKTVDAGKVLNKAMSDVFLAPPQDTYFAGTFGHLAGYSASYYGYAWADAIAADMATVFEKAPGGLMDKRIGMRMRNEIYATGGSRSIDESIRAFLKRERSIEPFLKSIGL
jgi:thimet oligopeptidase